MVENISNIKNIVWTALDKVDIELLKYAVDDNGELSSYIDNNLSYIAEKMNTEWYDSGATKSVFSFYEFPNYVIKIPFQGCYVIDSNYDPDSVSIGKFRTKKYKGASDYGYG